MANQFGGNAGEYISWSNGLTCVLLARIALAAAELYSTDWEQSFARFVATYDQNRGPLGLVGFDLADIPWGTSPEEVAAHKQFVLDVIALSATSHAEIWLPYYPNPNGVAYHRGALRKFHRFVRRFYVARYPEPIATEWKWYFPPADTVCVRHRVFCHAHGCMVCPDA